MAKEISIPKMYASEEIPCMLFDCPKDVDEFEGHTIGYWCHQAYLDLKKKGQLE